MSTNGVNFVALTSAAASGTGANSAALALAPGQATSLAQNGYGVVLDRFAVDLSKAGYAKNGCVLLAITGGTPLTVDLTNLTASGAYAGDTTFGTWNQLVFNNLGTAPVGVSPGATNPANTPLTGTSPGTTVPVGAVLPWTNPAGSAVTGTAKTLTFTSASNAILALIVGGA